MAEIRKNNMNPFCLHFEITDICPDCGYEIESHYISPPTKPDMVQKAYFFHEYEGAVCCEEHEWSIDVVLNLTLELAK